MGGALAGGFLTGRWLGRPDLALDGEDRERIAARLAGLPGPPGDVYSVERVAGGRHAAVMKMNLHRDEDR